MFRKIMCSVHKIEFNKNNKFISVKSRDKTKNELKTDVCRSHIMLLILVGLSIISLAIKYS